MKPSGFRARDQLGTRVEMAEKSFELKRTGTHIGSIAVALDGNLAAWTIPMASQLARSLSARLIVMSVDQQSLLRLPPAGSIVGRALSLPTRCP